MDEHIYYEVIMNCPVCKHVFKSTKTKAKIKETTPTAFESYLLPIYEGELINPLSYEVDVCPNCHYAAFHKDFKENTTQAHINAVNAFKEQIDKLSKGADFNVIYRNYEMGRLSYVIAAYIYEKEVPKDYIKLGKCYLRVAWYSKEMKEYEFYRTSLKKALDTYVGAYNEIDDFTTSSIIMYLIASINIELGDFDSALPYINKLNGNFQAKKIPAIKDKLEEATLKLRKVMKDIEEETKDMSDEDKKNEKIKRKEAVKTKPYELPFGIELEEPNTSYSEVRKEKQKTEIEKDFGIRLTGKPKVLIVDDSKVIRKNMEYLLESECDIVGVATNGSEGVQMYEVFKPDFVTLDVEMPGIDGIETLKKIKKIDPNAKVIMVTSHKDSKMVMEALKNGAMNYLLKPVNKEKLLEIIKKG